MKIATRVLLTLLLSFSTIQMLRCARSNPFDPEGTGFNEGGAPWIAFIRDELSAYTQDPVEFGFTWSDTGVGGTKGKIAAIQFDIDGDSVFEEIRESLSGSDTLVAQVKFDREMKSVIYARAIDKDGNAGNIDSINVSIHSGRPYLLSFPSGVTSFPNDSVSVWCAANDPNDRVVSYEWAVDNTLFNNFTSDSVFILPPFGSTGNHIVRVRAVDTHGAYSDTAQISVAVTDDPNSIDNVGPTIQFIGIKDGDTVNSRVLIVELRVEDEKSAVKIVSVNSRDAVLTGKFEPIYQCTVSLNPGVNYLNAEAIDAQFQRSFERISIVYDKEAVDQQPPVVKLMWPEEDQVLGIDSVTLALQVTDPSGVSEVAANGKMMSRRTDNLWELGLRLEKGENQVEVTAVDRKGNVDTVGFSFNYDPHLNDSASPVLSISQPADGTHVEKKKITVSGSAKDQSGVASLKVNDKSVALDGDFWEIEMELNHGENTITVVAVDKSPLKNETQKTITVTKNRPPEFLTRRDELDRNIIVETAYSPVFAFRDPDGDKVTLRFSKSSNWHSSKTPVLSVHGDSATVKNYVPSKVGLDTFVVILEDDWGDSSELLWTVLVSEPGNTSPRFTTNPKDFPDTILVDSLYEFVVSAQDPDDTELNYILKKPPTPADAQIVTKSGKITWKPSRADTGSIEFEVWVSDGDDHDILTWSMFVEMYNQKPELENPGNKTINEGEHLIFALSAGDPDGDALEYGFIEAPSWLKLNGNQCSLRPSFADAGVYTVVFEASEKNRIPPLSDRETITLTVLDVNRAPNINDPGPRQGAEGSTIVIELSAEDPDGDSVTFFAAGAPGGASIDGSVFTWNVPYDAPAGVEVTFIAEDSGNPPLRDSILVSISTNNVNQAPELDPISDTIMNENEQLRIALNATDPDGGVIAYSMDSSIDGADLTTGIFTWTPTYDQAGSYSVVFKAHDDGTPPLSDSIVVGITVQNVNRGPEITTDPESMVSFVRAGNAILGTVVAVDPDNDAMRFDIVSGPSGMTIGESSGILSWTAVLDAGIERDTIAIAVRVRDTYDAEDEIRWDLVVQAKWPYRYGNEFDVVAHDVVAVSHGGYVVCGAVSEESKGSFGGYLLRLTEDGDTLWTVSTSDPNSANGEALALVEHPDGGFVVVGWIDINGTRDVAVARIGANGSIIWTGVYPLLLEIDKTPMNEIGFDVIADADTREILICGISRSTNSLFPNNGPVLKGHRVSSGDNIFLLRIRMGENGATSKFQEVMNSGFGAFAIEKTHTDTLTLAGYSVAKGSGRTNPILVGIDYRKAEVFWKKEYGELESGAVLSMDFSQGAHVLAGVKKTVGGENEWVIRGTSSSGEELWVNRLKAGTDGAAYDVAFSNTTGIAYVCGSVRYGITGRTQIVVRSISSGGVVEWTNVYGLVQDDEFGYAIDAGPDTHLIVAGKSDRGGNEEAYVTRLESNGNIAR